MIIAIASDIENPCHRTADYYRRLAGAADNQQRTLLGNCPHCQGNVVRVTLPPNSEAHARCLQCARDLCCPPINQTL